MEDVLHHCQCLFDVSRFHHSNDELRNEDHNIFSDELCYSVLPAEFTVIAAQVRQGDRVSSSITKETFIVLVDCGCLTNLPVPLL